MWPSQGLLCGKVKKGQHFSHVSATQSDWYTDTLLPFGEHLKRMLCLLTASPLSPLIWGSNARSESAQAAVFAHLSHWERSPSALSLGSCDSWTGLQTVLMGLNLKKVNKAQLLVFDILKSAGAQCICNNKVGKLNLTEQTFHFLKAKIKAKDLQVSTLTTQYKMLFVYIFSH